MKNLIQIIFVLTLAQFIFGCNKSSNSSSPTAATATPGSSPTPGASPAATAAVQLSWQANPGEQQGFNIQISTNGTTFTPSQTVPDPTDTATITGLSAGQTYYFKISAYNQAGSSAFSSVISVIVP